MMVAAVIVSNLKGIGILIIHCKPLRRICSTRYIPVFQAALLCPRVYRDVALPHEITFAFAADFCIIEAAALPFNLQCDPGLNIPDLSSADRAFAVGALILRTPLGGCGRFRRRIRRYDRDMDRIHFAVLVGDDVNLTLCNPADCDRCPACRCRAVQGDDDRSVGKGHPFAGLAWLRFFLDDEPLSISDVIPDRSFPAASSRSPPPARRPRSPHAGG